MDLVLLEWPHRWTLSIGWPQDPSRYNFAHCRFSLSAFARERNDCWSGRLQIDPQSTSDTYEPTAGKKEAARMSSVVAVLVGGR
jgi:hypothetical protein